MCFKENYCSKSYLRRKTGLLKKKKKSGAKGTPCDFIQMKIDRHLSFANVVPIQAYYKTLMFVLLDHKKK